LASSSNVVPSSFLDAAHEGVESCRVGAIGVIHDLDAAPVDLGAHPAHGGSSDVHQRKENREVRALRGTVPGELATQKRLVDRRCQSLNLGDEIVYGSVNRAVRGFRRIKVAGDGGVVGV
jgi:hypothetical protein